MFQHENTPREHFLKLWKKGAERWLRGVSVLKQLFPEKRNAVRGIDSFEIKDASLTSWAKSNESAGKWLGLRLSPGGN